MVTITNIQFNDLPEHIKKIFGQYYFKQIIPKIKNMINNSLDCIWLILPCEIFNYLQPRIINYLRIYNLKIYILNAGKNIEFLVYKI